jgi:hypothetical protein
MKRVLVAIVLFALANLAYAQSDPLRSWNDGAAKKAILDFVADVSDEASPDFVEPEERIATFDNDGTLWAEKPTSVEFQFAIDRVKALAPQHPGLYSELVYQPMLELLGYLRANGFKTFIVSGGGGEFRRAFAEHSYGVPPEQVIGSEGKLKFEMLEGTPVLMKLPEVQFVDDNDGKPIGIEEVIGRRPIAAFGNSDGNLQMLQWTAAGPGKRFCLYVHHTDEVREWAYDRQSTVGRLDQGLDVANAKGWTVVSMKDDWKTIFPSE